MSGVNRFEDQCKCRASIDLKSQCKCRPSIDLKISVCRASMDLKIIENVVRLSI